MTVRWPELRGEATEEATRGEASSPLDEAYEAAEELNFAEVVNGEAACEAEWEVPGDVAMRTGGGGRGLDGFSAAR